MTLEANIELLKSFKEYNKGWNGVDSEIIPHSIIDIGLFHVSKFLIQPDILPYDLGIQFRWALNQNDLLEIDINNQIEFVLFLDDSIAQDQVIESKFISQYANRVLKQQLRNA